MAQVEEVLQVLLLSGCFIFSFAFDNISPYVLHLDLASQLGS